MNKDPEAKKKYQRDWVRQKRMGSTDEMSILKAKGSTRFDKCSTSDALRAKSGGLIEEGRPILHIPEKDGWKQLRDYLKADPSRLEKMQRIAGSLGKHAHAVWFGIGPNASGLTMEDIGKVIGVKPALVGMNS